VSSSGKEETILFIGTRRIEELPPFLGIRKFMTGLRRRFAKTLIFHLSRNNRILKMAFVPGNLFLDLYWQSYQG
jgi:hypothetical protein